MYNPLPSDAVKISQREENEFLGITKSIGFVIILVTVFFAFFVLLSYYIYECSVVRFSFPGLLLSFVAAIPHECLHAKAMGRGTADIYIVPRDLRAFVITAEPISRMRFVFMLLLPNVLLGWLPLFIWVATPHHETYSNALLTYAFFTIIMGVLDYLSTWDILRNASPGSVIQFKDETAYWYLPK